MNNTENSLVLDMSYYFKGSSNISLTLRKVGDDIDLITDFGEIITSVQSGYGLMRVLQDLYENKYA